MNKFTIMKVLQQPIRPFLFIAFVFLSLATTVRAKEVDDQSEFSYDLNSNNGPDNWGHIRPEWYLCNNGTMQSPINLMNKRVQVMSRLGKLRSVYKLANATLVNRGHDIQLRFEGDAGYILINGTQYFLDDCHWHSPSEHAIDGVRCDYAPCIVVFRVDLEMHCVHKSSAGKIAVIGILYKIGLTPDPFLAMFTDELIDIKNGSKESSAGLVDLRLTNIAISQYYRYIGSLTTPPCDEDVVWTVVKKVRNVSRAQVQSLRAACNDGFESNARPLQPLNDRVVQLYKPRAIDNLSSYDSFYLAKYR